jgi:hypothetical protein
VADAVALEDHAVLAGMQVEHVECGGAPALHRHRPPAVVARKRSGAHRGTHHARLAHLHAAEIGQHFLLQRFKLQPHGPRAGDEHDEARVMRRVERPLGEVVALGELDELVALLGEQLG